MRKTKELSLKLALSEFSSVALCLTLGNPMDCSTPGLPVHHQLPESTQTHVHQFGDAIQPSHSLLSPSPSAFSLSQNRHKDIKTLANVRKKSYLCISKRQNNNPLRPPTAGQNGRDYDTTDRKSTRLNSSHWW